MNFSKSLIQTSKLLRSKNLLNLSLKLFASHKKDGATQSESFGEAASAENGNVKIIESIPGNRVK